MILSSLGEVARDAGQPHQAWRLYGAALRRHSALGDKRHMAYELEGLASAAGMERPGRQALVYVGAAQVLREETGGPLPPAEQAILDRILAPALASLSAANARMLSSATAGTSHCRPRSRTPWPSPPVLYLGTRTREFL